MDIQKYIDQAGTAIIQYAPKALLAIVVLVIGLAIIKRLVRLTQKVMLKRDVDESLAKFASGLVSVLLKVLLFISVATMFGVATTSFVAVLGAMSLAVGMALQGSLGNFAGGALIMLFKPFKVGDLIEAQGHLGVVKEIQIFTTHLLSPHNKRIIIPNGPLSNGDIVNYTVEGMVRVDLTVGIGYGEDIKKAKEVIVKVLNDYPTVLKDPAPSANVSELADSSVNLLMLPYAKPENYWDVYFGVQEAVKYALDEANIEIPFPQRVMHNA